MNPPSSSNYHLIFTCGVSTKTVLQKTQFWQGKYECFLTHNGIILSHLSDAELPAWLMKTFLGFMNDLLFVYPFSFFFECTKTLFEIHVRLMPHMGLLKYRLVAIEAQVAIDAGEDRMLIDTVLAGIDKMA